MRFLLVAAVAATVAATPAVARNCYEGFGDEGCPWASELDAGVLEKQSCQNLAHIRNQLYNERDYCFSKPELAEIYDNSDCKYGEQDDVALNTYERANISRILKIEKDKGC